MAGVLQVRQIDDTHLHWRAEVGGKTEEWDAEVTQQVPDKLIARRSTGAAPKEDAVSFRKVSESRTRIELRIDYKPRGPVEMVGDAFGVVSMQAKGYLQRFKSFLEGRGTETGGWRGSVSDGQATTGTSATDARTGKPETAGIV